MSWKLLRLLEHWDIERGILPVQYFLIMGPPNILEIFSSPSVLSVLSSSTSYFLYFFSVRTAIDYDMIANSMCTKFRNTFRRFIDFVRGRYGFHSLKTSKKKRTVHNEWYLLVLYDTFLSTSTLILLLLSLLQPIFYQYPYKQALKSN